MSPSDQANRQYWVSRREEAPQPPTRISVADFVLEANRQLAVDKAFLPGTRFVVMARPGAGEQPSWEGPDSMRPLIQRIFQAMTSRFALDVPFRIDR